MNQNAHQQTKGLDRGYKKIGRPAVAPKPVVEKSFWSKVGSGAKGFGLLALGGGLVAGAWAGISSLNNTKSNAYNEGKAAGQEKESSKSSSNDSADKTIASKTPVVVSNPPISSPPPVSNPYSNPYSSGPNLFNPFATGG